MTYHIPNLGGCWWESRPHWCNEDPGHDGDHACCCGHSWPADPELEAAVRAYTAFYTVPYLDAPEIPTQAAALAACMPTDSPWRRVARAGGR